eukprot:3975082-Pleurochrysis_carterae.AAC.1
MARARADNGQCARQLLNTGQAYHPFRLGHAGVDAIRASVARVSGHPRFVVVLHPHGAVGSSGHALPLL